MITDNVVFSYFVMTKSKIYTALYWLLKLSSIIKKNVSALTHYSVNGKIIMIQ